MLGVTYRKVVLGAVHSPEDPLNVRTLDVVGLDQVVDQFVVVLAGADRSSHRDASGYLPLDAHSRLHTDKEN